MSKAAVVGAVVIIGVGAVGGGGYYYANQKAEQKFQEKIALIKSTFPGSTLNYENHHISVFSHQATLDKVSFKDKDGTVYTADKVDAVLGLGDTISKLGVDNFTLKDGNSNLSIERTDISDFSMADGAIVLEDGKIKRIFPSKFSFGLIDIKNLSVNDGMYLKLNLAQSQIKNYGLCKKTDTTLKDLVIKDKDMDFKLASLQFNQANQADIAKYQEEFIDDRNIRQNPELMLKKIFQNLSEIQFNLFSINGLQYSKYGMDFKLNHYDLKDYGLGHKISQSLKDLSITLPNGGSFKIASINNSGIDLALLVKSLQSVKFTYSLNLSQMVLQLQKAYLKEVKELQSNTEIAGLNFTKDQNHLSLGTLTINSSTSLQGKTQETYKLDGLEFVLPKDSYNPYLQLLKDVGYNTLSVSGTMNAQYQPDTEAMSLSLSNLAIKDVGIINANLNGNLPLEDLYADLNHDMVLMNPELKFKDFTLNVQNTGFIEKLVKKMSIEQKVSEDAVRKDLINQLDNTVKEMLPSSRMITTQEKAQDSALDNQVHQAMEKLLQDPQKTQVELISAPKLPITTVDFAGKNEQEIFDLFNIQVKAIPVK